MAKLHRLSLHNDFPICENNILHKRLSIPKRYHKTSTHLKPHAGKIYPNHSPLKSSSHTPILSMYHLSHYTICESHSFITRNSSSVKNEKDTNISEQSLYTQTTLSMIGEVRENPFGHTCGFAHKYSKSINP